MVSGGRILNERLAAALSTVRHGETIFLADAGMGTSEQCLTPLPASVEQVDLGIAPGLPSVPDLLRLLWGTGIFESAIVTREMRERNPEGRSRVGALVGEDAITEVDCEPDLYRLRDRTRLFVRTGDFAIHGNVILVAGYGYAGPIELKRLLGDWSMPS